MHPFNHNIPFYELYYAHYLFISQVLPSSRSRINMVGASLDVPPSSRTSEFGAGVAVVVAPSVAHQARRARFARYGHQHSLDTARLLNHPQVCRKRTIKHSARELAF